MSADLASLPDSPAVRTLRTSLLGDAIALGPHWIYDPAEITRRFGTITGPTDPPADLYHPRKKKGDQTHYGDQTVCLVRSILDNGGRFDAAHFADRWRAMWDGYADYFDKATKHTLAALKAGTPWENAASASTELGGAARLGALLVSDAAENEDRFVEAARAQTAVTHRSAEALAAAGFLARAVFRRQHGASLLDALASAVGAEPSPLPFDAWLARATKLASGGKSGAEIIEETGASCDAADALPASLALALRFSSDPHRALCENAQAGGDSAARGLVIGLLVG